MSLKDDMLCKAKALVCMIENDQDKEALAMVSDIKVSLEMIDWDNTRRERLMDQEWDARRPDP